MYRGCRTRRAGSSGSRLAGATALFCRRIQKFYKNIKKLFDR